MNIKINIRRAAGLFWHEHVHFLASLTCGVAMGVLFSMRVSTYQAHYFQAQYAELAARSAPSVTQEVHMTSNTMQTSTEETLTFFANYASSASASTSSSVKPVKKGKQVMVVAEPVASSAPQAAATSSKAAAPRTPRIVVVAPEEPATVEQHSSSLPATASESAVSSSREAVHSSAAASSIPSASSSSQAPVVAEPLPEPEPEPIMSSVADTDFPAFIRTSHPVSRVPNWGAWSTPAQWKRSYSEMTDADYVPVPAYNLKTLTIPLKSLTSGSVVSEADIPKVTAKLYYSTRYMGKYDLDAGEHTGNHAGVDLKLALGTPIGAIGGGRVYAVKSDPRLGLHVIIEHRNDSGQFFSVYAHLGSAKVATGDAVKPGQTIGFVGLTGKTTMAHLHLEVHKGAGIAPDGLHGAAYSDSHPVNPMTFIATGGNAN